MRKLSKVKNSLVLNDFEALLHRVTSNDEQFPSEAEIAQLVQASHARAEREQTMRHLWRKLYGPREKWRKILKALTVLQRLMLEGSEEVLAELRGKIGLLNFLLQFRLEEKGVELGERVRALAEEIVQKVRGEAAPGEAGGDDEPRAPRPPAPHYFGADFLVYGEERPADEAFI